MASATRRTQKPACGNGRGVDGFVAELIVFCLNRPVTPVLPASRQTRRTVLESILN